MGRVPRRASRGSRSSTNRPPGRSCPATRSRTTSRCRTGCGSWPTSPKAGPEKIATLRSVGDQGQPAAQAERPARLGLGPGRPRLVRPGLRPRPAPRPGRRRRRDLRDRPGRAVRRSPPPKRRVRLREEADGRPGPDRRRRLRRPPQVLQRRRDRRADPPRQPLVFFNLLTEAAGLPLDAANTSNTVSRPLIDCRTMSDGDPSATSEPAVCSRKGS